MVSSVALQRFVWFVSIFFVFAGHIIPGEMGEICTTFALLFRYDISPVQQSNSPFSVWFVPVPNLTHRLTVSGIIALDESALKQFAQFRFQFHPVNAVVRVEHQNTVLQLRQSRPHLHRSFPLGQIMIPCPPSSRASAVTGLPSSRVIPVSLHTVSSVSASGSGGINASSTRNNVQMILSVT